MVRGRNMKGGLNQFVGREDTCGGACAAVEGVNKWRRAAACLPHLGPLRRPMLTGRPQAAYHSYPAGVLLFPGRNDDWSV